MPKPNRGGAKTGNGGVQAANSIQDQMTGTPKQIKFANDIKQTWKDQIDTLATNSKAAQVMKDILDSQTSASFWINEIQNKAVIDIKEVLRKAAGAKDMNELLSIMQSKM